MRFRVARPPGRADGWVEVYLGSPGASTASILAGTPVGKVAVPETGDWQVYQTIEACLESAEGTYDVVLNFDEVGSTSGRSLFNLNSFSVVSPLPALLGGSDIVLNQGATQRSMLMDLEVTFSGDVQIGNGAFSVVNREDNSSVDVSVDSSTVGGDTVATLTFSGPYAITTWTTTEIQAA